MAVSRDKVTTVFEEFFSTQLNQPFDENAQIKDIDGFDSLAMVDLSIAFEDAFDISLNLDTFKNATCLKDVVDEAARRLA